MILGEIIEESILQSATLVRVRTGRLPASQIIVGEKVTPTSRKTESRTQQKEFLHTARMKFSITSSDVST